MALTRGTTVAGASQPIFDIQYRGILSFRVKNTESGESQIFLLDPRPVYYREFSWTQIEVDATTFTVSRTCEVPVMYREMVNFTPQY
jgi:hypothetical protein